MPIGNDEARAAVALVRAHNNGSGGTLLTLERVNPTLPRTRMFSRPVTGGDPLWSCIVAFSENSSVSCVALRELNAVQKSFSVLLQVLK